MTTTAWLPRSATTCDMAKATSIRMDDDDFDKLHQIARHLDMNHSEVIRALIQAAYDNYDPPVTISREEYERLKAFEASQQGSNMP